MSGGINSLMEVFILYTFRQFSEFASFALQLFSYAP
jgi:hypothetical protein